MAAPFWGGDGWRYEGYEELELPESAATILSQPMSLYQCQDDEIVPYNHLALYSELFPSATVHELSVGGHQFNNDLKMVAQDIKNL